jgi:hypothetical protein
MTTAQPSATTVRATWAAQLDRAARRLPTLFRRSGQGFALVPIDLLTEALARSVPTPVAVPDGDGWSVLLPGHPVAADGDTLDAAVDDFVSALRDYATAWQERLHLAANHRHAALLVQLITAVDDDALRGWIVGTRPATSAAIPA